MCSWFYARVKDQICLGSPESRLAHSVLIYNRLYTWMVDGCEQPVHASGDDIIDTRFYSEKKKQRSINIIAVIGINQRILYLSPSFPASINDREIAEKTKAEWCDQLEDVENGLADCGFRGMRKQGWRLDITGEDRSKPSFKLFSSYRIRSEQKWAQFKDFAAARECLRTNPLNEELLLWRHHRHWTIIAVFLNDFRQRLCRGLFFFGCAKKFVVAKFATECATMKADENLCSTLQDCAAHLATLITSRVITHCRVWLLTNEAVRRFSLVFMQHNTPCDFVLYSGREFFWTFSPLHNLCLCIIFAREASFQAVSVRAT